MADIIEVATHEFSEKGLAGARIPHPRGAARGRHLEVRPAGDLAVFGGIVSAFKIFDGWGEDNCAIRNSMVAICQQMDFSHRAAHLD